MTQTTTIKAGESAKTITIQEGLGLVLTGMAGAIGMAYQLDPILGGTNSVRSWTIGAGALPQIGPFAGQRKVLVTCEAGAIEATLQSAVLGMTSGGGASDIAFSNVISLTSGGAAFMPKQTIAGGLVFAAAPGSLRNSSVYLPLVANGVNAPDFSAFKEWGGSMGWDNTAGMLNSVQFFSDGYDVYVFITQATSSATVPGDTTAPVRQSATVNSATLVLAFNESLNTAVPALSSFSYLLNGGTAVNPTAVSVSGSNVTLTFATAALQGQSATLSYTPGTNPIRDTAGNAAAAFSGVAVTNSTPASDTTAPAIQSATMNGATLAMTYGEALNSTAPTLSAFSLSLAGGAGAAPTAAAVSGATVTLTFATAATPGQSAALTYTPGTSAIRDAAGNNAAALTSYAVTNNTAAAGTEAPLQFTANPTYYLEAVDGNGDFTYTSTSAIGSGYQAVSAMSGIKSLPAGADGGFWISSSTDGSSQNSLVGFKAGDAAPGGVIFSTWNASIIDPAVGSVYVTRVGSTATNATVKKEAGDLIGIFEVGKAIIARIARAAAPSTWIDVATIATDVNLKLWPMVQAQQHPSQKTFVKPRYTGGLV
jgi:uncharacterized repeat protein (TIGR02059 family)